MNKFITLLIISGFLLILSCKKDKEETEIWTIGSERIDCMALLPTKCYAVKREGEIKWGYLSDSIDGFTYEEGYEYVLKVKIEPIKNPLQDGSSLKYTLIEMLSKVKKTSENLSGTSNLE